MSGIFAAGLTVLDIKKAPLRGAFLLLNSIFLPAIPAQGFYLPSKMNKSALSAYKPY